VKRRKPDKKYGLDSERIDKIIAESEMCPLLTRFALRTSLIIINPFMSVRLETLSEGHVTLAIPEKRAIFTFNVKLV